MDTNTTLTERISQTGIRDNEYITSSISGSQCKGVIIQVKGVSLTVTIKPTKTM